ncbi:MAG: hypothetical protein KF686_03370 [Ramlibacter sp.]|nr:hypothetical protein [Ramlibacter sp.]
MKGSVIIGKAQLILQDESASHWAPEDLLGWLNTAQRMLVMARPDAKTTRGEITAVAGPHQSLPDDGLRLIRVVRNKDGRAVTLISEEQLTNFDRDWYSAAAKAAAKHYLFDPLEPKRFDVYPPAVAGNKLVGVWSTLPTDLNADTDDIDVDDIYEMPLVYLVCHLGYLQDAEDTANLALAEKHLGYAMLMLTGKSPSDAATNPATSQPAKIKPQVR